MATYMIKIQHENGMNAEVEVEPTSNQRWNIIPPVPNWWTWGKIGHYTKPVHGVSFFKDTSQPSQNVFRVDHFNDPPIPGSSGSAAFEQRISMGQPNAKWKLLSTASQIANIENEIKQVQKEIDEMWGQVCIDVIGVIDPTPISDGTGIALHIQKGEYGYAALSFISLIPLLGDAIGKSSKGAKFIAKLEKLRRKLRLLRKTQKVAPEVATKLNWRVTKRFQKIKYKHLPEKIRKMRHEIPAKVFSVAEEAGINPNHLNNWRIFASLSEPPKVVILRNRNKASLKYEKIGGIYKPKPVDIKLKTAKTGENAGLVVYPKPHEIKPDEIESTMKHIAELKKKGFRFEPDEIGGVLISPEGTKYFGDIDKMGIYDVRKLESGGNYGSRWNTGRANDSTITQNEINTSIYENIKNDRHGGQDFFFKEYNDVAKHYELGRFPDKDEMFTIIKPDGNVEMVNLNKLNQVYGEFGITNPYKVQ